MKRLIEFGHRPGISVTSDLRPASLWLRGSHSGVSAPQGVYPVGNFVRKTVVVGVGLAGTT